MKKILGNYNMKEEMDSYINILWLSYIDWASVHVYIDYETSQMTYIEVSCFDIESKLGIKQNHESVENNEVTEENVTEPTE